MRDEVPRMQAGGEGWRVTPARKPGPSFLTLRPQSTNTQFRRLSLSYDTLYHVIRWNVESFARSSRRCHRSIRALKNIVSQGETANEVLPHRQFCRAEVGPLPSHPCRFQYPRHRG